MRRYLAAFLIVVLCAISVPVLATDPHEGSGLPVPRFASTRSDAVNVRTGPGERYPVKWILRRKAVPVEIIGEYDNWRKIRDWEGGEGWVHHAMLSGRRFVVIYPNKIILREKAETDASGLAELSEGVIARVQTCRADWCQIKINETEGWAPRSALWGIQPGEKLD